MRSTKKSSLKFKYGFAAILIGGLTLPGAKAFSQSSLPPHPTPPPPSEFFNKINPFKKSTKDTSYKTDTTRRIAHPARPVHPTGPPPNPLNWFHKKKQDTVKAVPPSEKA